MSYYKFISINKVEHLKFCYMRPQKIFGRPHAARGVQLDHVWYMRLSKIPEASMCAAQN